jgi:4-hydroxybenzoate polyprenyltransferase
VNATKSPPSESPIPQARLPLPTHGNLARRLWAYQAERFPLAAYVPLIATFTFSSAAFSRLARQAPGFIDPNLFVIGTATALAFFFLLRVLDEHKDADVDRRYRPELPVPRGLVSLAELRWVAVVMLGALLVWNGTVAPRLLWAWLAFGAWAALMTREFFVRDWLRAHIGVYLITHMAIMPMIDAYTTGLDWLVEGVPPPHGLWLFLAVTFGNGVLIEIGRKLKAPEQERDGVDTYTSAWGVRRAPVVWLVILVLTAVTAWLAARHTGAGMVTGLVLVILLLAAAIPALQFLTRPSAARARALETASGLWPIGTYLLLGGGPFVARAMKAGF